MGNKSVKNNNADRRLAFSLKKKMNVFGIKSNVFGRSANKSLVKPVLFRILNYTVIKISIAA